MDVWFRPQKKVSRIVQEIAPKSVLDIGCGLGNTVNEFRRQGIEALGLEGSELAIRKSEVADFIKQANLNYPVDLKRKFDLVWCVEVLEHIHPKYVQNIIGTICRHGDNLLVSAAPLDSMASCISTNNLKNTGLRNSGTRASP